MISWADGDADLELLEALDAFLAKSVAFSVFAPAPTPADDRAWREIAAFGLPAALMAPERTPFSLSQVMERFGARAAADPIVDWAYVAPRVLDMLGAPGAELLPAIAARAARVSLRLTGEDAPYLDDAGLLHGEWERAPGGPLATHLICRARTARGDALALAEVAAARVEHHDYRSVDGVAASDFRFNGAAIRAVSAIGPAQEQRLARLADAADVARCGEAVGLMRVLIKLTGIHLSTRRQFGAPLASFQALRHLLADMAMEAEKAAAITRRAAERAHAGPAAALVAGARLATSQAVRLVSQSAVQLHGAAGTVADTPISHGFRRAMGLERRLGSRAAALDLYAAAL